MVGRSYLYVPGDRETMLSKARERGADALIVDLEDAVAPASKSEALEITASWVAEGHLGGPPVWVRVNNHPDLIDTEIRSVVGPHLTGIMVPKIESAADMAAAAAIVSDAEQLAGLSSGSIRMMAFIETAAAVLAVDGILGVDGVDGIVLGEADLSAELAVRLSPNEREFLPFRMQMIVACAAAGLDPPVGPVHTDFRDLDALRRSTEALARMGFMSRQAIHPAQVPVINDVFTPDLEQVERARRLVEAADSAMARGDGVFLDDDGRLVDEAILRSARRIVEVAERALDVGASE